MTKTPEEYLALAEVAAKKAYAPYSEFHVGSVLISEHGNTYMGCNVENISYGLSSCSERNTIFQAIAYEGRKMKIKELYVAIGEGKEGAPCGACRQVIAEFGKDARVFFRHKGKVIETKGKDLLPYPFDEL